MSRYSSSDEEDTEREEEDEDDDEYYEEAMVVPEDEPQPDARAHRRPRSSDDEAAEGAKGQAPLHPRAAPAARDARTGRRRLAYLRGGDPQRACWT